MCGVPVPFIYLWSTYWKNVTNRGYSWFLSCGLLSEVPRWPGGSREMTWWYCCLVWWCFCLVVYGGIDRIRAWRSRKWLRDAVVSCILVGLYYKKIKCRKKTGARETERCWEREKRDGAKLSSPAVDLALPVSTGPESSSVSDLAYNGSVTGSALIANV